MVDGGAGSEFTREAQVRHAVEENLPQGDDYARLREFIESWRRRQGDVSAETLPAVDTVLAAIEKHEADEELTDSEVKALAMFAAATGVHLEETEL